LPTRWPFTAYARILASARACGHDDDPSRSDGELHGGAWRGTVVECNFRRVARIFKRCDLDRRRLEFWRTWLGEGPPEEANTASRDDLWDLLEARVRSCAFSPSFVAS
jgi:hypothetical protein